MSLSLQLGLVYLISEVLLTLLRQAFGGQASTKREDADPAKYFDHRHLLRKHPT